VGPVEGEAVSDEQKPKAACLEEVELVAQRLARVIDNSIPRGWGFALVLSRLNTNLSSYVSNCNRADMIKAFREMADRLEKKERGL